MNFYGRRSAEFPNPTFQEFFIFAESLGVVSNKLVGLASIDRFLKVNTTPYCSICGWVSLHSLSCVKAKSLLLRCPNPASHISAVRRKPFVPR